MSQPEWKFIANLGDVNPIDYGGFFVYVDQTGVYDPEVEVLELVEGDDDDEFDEDDELVTEGNMVWETNRFSLEQFTYGLIKDDKFVPLTELHPEGILSDNKFHPDHAVWFAKPEIQKLKRPQDGTYLSDLCKSNDMDQWELIEMFLSDDAVTRARAYREVMMYHGINNLDQYPIRWESRKELEERYKGQS